MANWKNCQVKKKHSKLLLAIMSLLYSIRTQLCRRLWAKSITKIDWIFFYWKWTRTMYKPSTFYNTVTKITKKKKKILQSKKYSKDIEFKQLIRVIVNQLKMKWDCQRLLGIIKNWMYWKGKILNNENVVWFRIKIK